MWRDIGHILGTRMIPSQGSMFTVVFGLSHIVEVLALFADDIYMGELC